MEPKSNKIENLVFQGGGVLGFAYIGALQRLDSAEILTNVKNFAGSSIGSLFATILAMGGTVDYIKKITTGIKLKSFYDDSWTYLGDLYSAYYYLGFCAGNKLEAFFKSIVKELTGEEKFTFADLYAKTSNILIITGSNVNTGETVYFSYKTFPDMPIYLALRISCGYTIYFQPILYMGDYYTDGGLWLNYPLRVFDSDGEPNTGTIGMKLINISDNATDSTQDTSYHFYSSRQTCFSGIKERIPINSFTAYSLAIINKMYARSQAIYEHPDDEIRTIPIYIKGIDSMDLNITKTQIEYLELQGYEAADKYLSVVHSINEFSEDVSIMIEEINHLNNNQEYDISDDRIQQEFN